MRLHFGVCSAELDSLFRACDRIDRRAENIAFGVAVHLSTGLQQLHQLRLALERIEQDHSALIRQLEAG